MLKKVKNVFIKLTIKYEDLSEKLTGSNSGISSLDSYGNTVKIKYENKTKSFKAKDGVSFRYGGEVFMGLKCTEDGGLNNSNSNLDVFGGSSKFLRVVYENDGNYVLNHVKSPNGYYLKLKKSDKAVYLGDKAIMGNRSEEKTKKIFDKYVGCSALDFSNYDTNTKEGLIQLITDFLATCN